MTSNPVAPGALPHAQRLSVSAGAARNLATATVTALQNSETTPRWLHRLLPWVDVAGGVYRVNRRKVLVVRPGRVSIEGGAIVPASLARIPSLSALAPEILARLAELFEARDGGPGDVLFQPGEVPPGLVVVADGTIDLTVPGPFGTDLRQKLIGAGGYFGEETLAGHDPAGATVTARSTARVLVLTRQAIAGVSGVPEAIVQAVADRAGLEAQSNLYGETRIDLLAGHSGEPQLPTTFVDYVDHPREYHLSTIQTVLHTHTRITDLYSNQVDQLREQVRLTVEAVKEREEWELLNNRDFGLLNEVASGFRIPTRSGPPTPDDLDELLALIWKKPAFFLAHPRAIAAFGREATRRGVPPATVSLFGSPFITWRGVPLIPSDKVPVTVRNGVATSSILLLRVGEAEQGVVGLQKAGVTGEVEPGLSVRYSGTSEHSIASHLVTRYFSAAVLVEDAIARLDNVLLGNYHAYQY